MSGPKVDVAEIRRQEKMKLEAARTARKALAGKIKQLLKQIGDNGALEQMSREPSLKPACDEIRGLQEKYSEELTGLLKKVRSGNEMLETKEIEQRIGEITGEFQKLYEQKMIVLNDLAGSSIQFREMEKNRQQLQQMQQRRIVEVMQESSGESGVSAETVEEAAGVFRIEFEKFMTGTHMLSKHKQSMLLLQQDVQEVIGGDFSPERKLKRIRRLYDEFTKMATHIRDGMEEIEALYEEYLMESFDLTDGIREIESFGSKEELEKEIGQVKQLADSSMSKEYIRRQIDEVMAKHGYDVVRSELLSELNESGRILYGVDQATAIDVFVSEGNQVTMRVVGIGFDTDISAAEDERLFQQQCAFCSMHPQITQELANRGVVLQTKKHNAPDKKFNKKIRTENKTETQSKNRARKDLKQTELKKMYRE